MPKYKYGPRDPMKIEEVKEMINETHVSRNKCLIATLYLTGARISEVIGLKREDFEYGKDELVITVAPLKKKKGSPLRKYNRLIFDRKEAPFIEHIENHLAKIENQESFIFSGQTGHLSRTQAWRIIKDLNENTSPHFFRHTRISKLDKKGVSLDALRKWSGRETPPVEYIETKEEEIREIGKEVD